MAIHGVALNVAPQVRVECKFWLGEDGWQGSCEQPPITVHADSFERVKSEMEWELGRHIENLLRQSQKGVGYAA